MKMWKIGAIIIAVAFGASNAAHAVTFTGSDYTFSFTGNCTDCAYSDGTLKVQGYTLGDPFNNSNFVSFDYQSNLEAFSLTATDLILFSGSLAAPFPSTNADVRISGSGTVGGGEIYDFQTFSGGWDLKVFGTVADFGSSYSWDNAAAAVPGPMAGAGIPGLIAAFGGLLAWWRRRAVAI
jgi:hypothetical protein